ncbi:hypothetical protein FRC04_001757 [Tulasnella sp. 424]|nr:hypothetical protein FRC04_001757 [Tulasnella sp. 424]KAG8968493.1 hypothetical protein FRC05_001560 [Tulasnella sp. 425]
MQAPQTSVLTESQQASPTTELPYLPPKPARPSPLLTEPELTALLQHVSTWSLGREGDKPAMSRDYKFAKFKYAVEFVNDMVKIINDDNHHPVIVLNFREVGVRTLTHVAFHETPDGSHVRDQGVTAFDVRLAMRVEKLYEDYVARGYHFVPKSKPPS